MTAGARKAALALWQAPRNALVLLVRLYQLTLGPLVGGRCRFEPTCSSYFIEAVRSHGAVRGAMLGAWRILRCNPFGGSGYDPAPRRGGPAADE